MSAPGRRPANTTPEAPPARSDPRTSATDWLSATPEGISLAVLAAPRASRTEVVGVADGRLRIRVAAPPVEGEANRELVRFLATALGVPRGAVAVTAGANGRRKTIRVRGIVASDALRLLPPPNRVAPRARPG